MSHLSSFYPQCGTAWLLALGERLRVEYDRMAEPLPPRLIALLEQLGTPPQDRVQRQGSPTLSLLVNGVINRVTVAAAMSPHLISCSQHSPLHRCSSCDQALAFLQIRVEAHSVVGDRRRGDWKSGAPVSARNQRMR